MSACRKNKTVVRGVCLDHYHKTMKFFVVVGQVNEVYLYFYKLKFEIMATIIAHEQE